MRINFCIGAGGNSGKTLSVNFGYRRWRSIDTLSVTWKFIFHGELNRQNGELDGDLIGELIFVSCIGPEKDQKQGPENVPFIDLLLLSK